MSLSYSGVAQGHTSTQHKHGCFGKDTARNAQQMPTANSLELHPYRAEAKRSHDTTGYNALQGVDGDSQTRQFLTPRPTQRVADVIFDA